MAGKCLKCGSDIDGKSPICMNCGSAIPISEISEETKERLKNDNTTQSTANASSVKALGAFLIIAGIGADVVSMFMISGADFESFGAITIFGTIAFLLGLVLFSNG